MLAVAHRADPNRVRAEQPRRARDANQRHTILGRRDPVVQRLAVRVHEQPLRRIRARQHHVAQRPADAAQHRVDRVRVAGAHAHDEVVAVAMPVDRAPADRGVVPVKGQRDRLQRVPARILRQPRVQREPLTLQPRRGRHPHPPDAALGRRPVQPAGASRRRTSHDGPAARIDDCKFDRIEQPDHAQQPCLTRGRREREFDGPRRAAQLARASVHDQIGGPRRSRAQ